MGGGDLNLKKSWHPQTLKNVERVWKAEQKILEEKKKMDALQKELTEERNADELRKLQEVAGLIKKQDEKLTWMYQSNPNQLSRDIQEEYLLGKRKVSDKVLETNPLDEPKEESITPGLANNAQDLAAKIREDPLLAIKKREQQTLNEIISNPLKVKKFKEMKQKLSKKSKKKSKKESRSKSRSKSRSRSPISSHSKNRSRSRSNSRERSRNDNRSRNSRNRSRSRSHSPIHSRSRNRSRSNSRGRYNNNHNHNRNSNGNGYQVSRNRSRSNSRGRYNNNHSRNSRNYSNSRSRSPSPQRRNLDPPKKMTDEERRAKLEQMQSNAKWNKDLRDQRINEYQEKDRKEVVEEEETKKSKKPDFLQVMKKETFSNVNANSLAERVQRNIHTIQRTDITESKFVSR